MDTSFKTPEELEKEIQLPVLVSMPFRYTEKELKIQKTKKILAAASVTVVFVLSAFSILFTIKGVDATLNFIRELYTKIWN